MLKSDTTEIIQIHWTCGSLDEAREIARELVLKKMVACANIIPWVESIFLWDETLDVTQETKVIFKTTTDSFEKVKDFILERSKYEVPEILQLPVTDGNLDYIEWVKQTTLN